MTSTVRLSHAARADIASILARSTEQFGEAASRRYQTLIAAAIRDAASDHPLGRTDRPELGQGVFTWHLAQSRRHVAGSAVRRPRHFLVCRRDADVLLISRVLHDAMDPERHLGDRSAP
ncbi:type II toxin-antitoxin system RelE/ParE family toxin [Agrococcus baldri]|uniref:Plasmid stabilization protein ParE n=1 Tax=Agrococcus baldri TaxID=153730 RepID=A0AA87UT65_9MICO|nr:plasmid stabilization protein ParE [Agrococcus baldri]